jgi:hypothetical protein
LKRADEFKVKGNELFTKGEYMDASIEYQFALDEVPPKHEVAAIYYNNLAACHKNLKEWTEAVTACTKGALSQCTTRVLTQTTKRLKLTPSTSRRLYGARSAARRERPATLAPCQGPSRVRPMLQPLLG